MTTITFDAENADVPTIVKVLKALGAKKIKVKESFDKVKSSKNKK